VLWLWKGFGEVLAAPFLRLLRYIVVAFVHVESEAVTSGWEDLFSAVTACVRDDGEFSVLPHSLPLRGCGGTGKAPSRGRLGGTRPYGKREVAFQVDTGRGRKRIGFGLQP